MTEKELAVRLVRHGIATQRRTPNKHAEANQDAEVRAAGNAAIANALEFLGKHAVVADVQPTFGSAGIGFSYTITPQLVHDLATDDAIESHVDALFSGPKTETSETIRELLAGCERRTLNAIYSLVTRVRGLLSRGLLYRLSGTIRQDSGDMSQAGDARP